MHPCIIRARKSRALTALPSDMAMKNMTKFYIYDLHKYLIFLLIGTSLSACGGGSGGDNNSNSYTISTRISSGGSISPLSATVKKGETVSFTIRPDNNYSITSVTGCNGQLSGNLFLTDAISADCTLNVRFSSNTLSMSIADTSINEGNSGTRNMPFTITLSSSASSTVSVDYSTADGTALAGSDYIATSGSINFMPGETSKTIMVSIKGDSDIEADETLILNLSNPSIAISGSTSATGTITNDDNQTGGNTPPVTRILSSGYSYSRTRQFRGESIDAEDGNLSGASLVWSSSIDGVLGTGVTYSSASLSAGTHIITLTGTDSQGLSSSATASIFINLWPTANISSPATNSQFVNTDNITFTGSATDPEDGNLSGTSLRWSSSIDGNLGTGQSLTTNLSVGIHLITLSAADSKNAIDQAKIIVTVSSVAWRNETDLNMGIPEAHSAILNNKIYVVGNSLIMQMYDPSTKTWSNKTSAGGQFICTSNGKLYSFGRLVLTNGNTTQKVYEAIGVDEYEPINDIWIARNNMPSAAASASGCHDINGLLYLPGTSSVNTYIYDGLFQYNPVTDSWIQKASLPSGRKYSGSSVANGKLYIIGGSANGSTSSAWYTSTVFEYNPVTNTWNTKKPMPTPRKRLSAATFNGKIYAFGGFGNNGISNKVEVYDPATDSWATKTPMLLPRRDIAVSLFNFDNRIYLIGGNGGSNLGLIDVESYDPLLD